MSELSAEEQKELQALEQDFALSQGEEAELAQLESEFATQGQEKPFKKMTPEEAFAPDPSLLTHTPSELMEEGGTQAALVAGGLEGVPFAKDIQAMVQAGKDALTNDTEESLGQVYDNYKQNLHDINKSINKLEQDHPIAAGVGEAITGMATLGAANGVKSVFATGALAGFSRAEERDLTDLATGGLGALFFHGIGKSVVKVVGNLFRREAAGAGKLVISGAGKRNLMETHKHLMDTGQSTQEFIGSLHRTGLMKPGAGLDELAENVVKAEHNIGDKIGKIYRAVDDAGHGKVNTQDVLHKVKSSLSKELSSDSGKTKALANSVINDFKEAFVEVNEKIILKEKDGVIEKVVEQTPTFREWSVSRLHKFYRDTAKLNNEVIKSRGGASPKAVSKAGMEEKALGPLIDTMEEVVEGAANKLDDATMKGFKQLKKDFRNVKLSRTLVTKRVVEVGESSGQSVTGNIKELIRNSISIKGLLAGGALTGGNVPSMAGTALALSKAGHHPGVSSSVSRSFTRLADFVQKNPNSKIITDLVTAANYPSVDAFNETLAASIGEMNLTENPIKRNSEDIMSKMNSLLPLIDKKDADIGQRVRDAISSGDDEAIIPLVDQISKMPEAASLFEPGIGIDGKVYDPNDKMMLETELLGNNKISTVQRMRMVKELRVNGTIPDLKSVQPREPRQYQKRNKTGHNY